MIRVILTPRSVVVALGDLELVTVFTLRGPEHSWWWRDRKLGPAVVGVA